MERAKAASDDRGRSHEQMQALLLAYDAADFRGRHDLLDREGLTIRDVARWRRDVARQTTADGESARPAAPKKKPVPVVLEVQAETPTAGVTAAPLPSHAADEAIAELSGAVRASQATKAGRGRSRRAAGSAKPAGPLTALRSDVVAAHASALVYHADALAKLVVEAPKSPGERRRPSAIDRLTDLARQTSVAAREVLSTRRRSGDRDTPTRDAVDVSAELTDMLSTLSDYSSLAVAVQLLARELDPNEESEASRARRLPARDRQRRPWWGAVDEAVDPADAGAAQPREHHTWGAKRTVS